MRKQKGFTLIELLIVIAIIAIIAAVVFVALDPLTRFQDARNAQRWTDVSALMGAIKVDQVDNGGAYIAAVSGITDGNTHMIGTCASGATGCTASSTIEAACADLSGLITEGYIGSIPTDASTGSDAQTDYYIYKDGSGILKIGACDPEGGATIEIAR